MSELDAILVRLRAAGERTRLRILFLLRHGELNVKDLTVVLGQSQPRVSRHLKLLSEADLIERHREGNSVYFRHSANTASARLSEAMLQLIDANDPVVRNDLARLEAVRTNRAREAQAYFDSHAGEWDRIRALHIAEDEVEAAMRDMAGPGPFPAMLDLGTGTGRVLELFANDITQGIGIDLSPEMLAIARTKLTEAGHHHCQIRQGNLTEIPYEDGSQNLISLHQVLHFFDNPGRVIGEAARLLAPGGRLLVVDFAPHELEFLREQHAHRRLGFSHAQMQEWFARAGLDMQAKQDLHRTRGSSNSESPSRDIFRCCRGGALSTRTTSW